MSEEGVERKLTTILATDVVGYSRLMGADEVGTLAALKAHRKELIDPKAAQYGGRTVKLMGDGALMEFGSVVDAVKFAIEVQCAIRERYADAPEDRRISYRIGINIGDIIVEDEDIYGDGVNIAARLEGLAEPGGICISDMVWQGVEGKLECAFENLGEQQVKNIEKPVRIYRVLLEPEPHAPPATNRGSAAARTWGLAAVVALLVIGAAAAWYLLAYDPATRELAEALPDKPSIAVLPFANLSGEPEQESFADGISEDLTTQLSKISGLFVISRTSTFKYKGQAIDIRELAQELGVRYVVEGSVRRGGDQIRINAQLIDTTTGGHLWAESYDGASGEVFSLQDRINGNIVAALKVQLMPEEQERVTYRGTDNVEAYDAFLRGERIRLYAKVRAHEDAIREYERAIELDPKFGAAHAALGDVIWSRAMFETYGGGPKRDELARAHTLADKAVELGEDPLAHTLLAKIFLIQKVDHQRAEAEARKANALDPNNTESLVMLAEVLLYTDKVGAAIELLKGAMRLNPGFPTTYRLLLAQALFEQRQYRDALDQLTTACKGAISQTYDLPCVSYTVSAYGHLGEIESGRNFGKSIAGRGANIAQGIERLETEIILRFPFKVEASREHLISGIRKVWPND